MNADVGRWMALAFILGMAAFVALAGVLGLHRHTGVRHRRRNLYGVAVAAFFLAIVVVMTELESEVRWSAAFVAQATIFAALLATLAIRWTRGYYSKNIVDGVFMSRKPSLPKFFLVYFATFVVVQAAGSTDLLLPVLWPYLLGAAIGFFALTLFSYRHVAQLERDLGRPLLEAPAPKPRQS